MYTLSIVSRSTLSGATREEPGAEVLLERGRVRAQRGFREHRGRVQEPGQALDGPLVRSREVVVADDREPGLGEHGHVRHVGHVAVVPGRNPILGAGNRNPLTHDPAEDALPFLVAVPR